MRRIRYCVSSEVPKWKWMCFRCRLFTHFSFDNFCPESSVCDVILANNTREIPIGLVYLYVRGDLPIIAFTVTVAYCTMTTYFESNSMIAQSVQTAQRVVSMIGCIDSSCNTLF